MATASSSTDIGNIALSYCGVTKQMTAIATDDTTESNLCLLHYDNTVQELIELYPFNEIVEYRALVLMDRYEPWEDEYAYDPLSITGITAASPPVVTISSHGLGTGDMVRIWDVDGMTEVNRDAPYHITKATDDTFQLTGEDSTNWTAYSSGGYARLVEPAIDYREGYVYELPSDYGKAICLDGGGEYEIRNSRLITNEADAVLYYTKSGATTVTNWASLFVDLVAARLAVKIAPGIFGSPSPSADNHMVRLGKMEEKAMYRAMFAAASEIKKDGDTEDPWLSARTS
jgi:hypothetical protein